MKYKVYWIALLVGLSFFSSCARKYRNTSPVRYFSYAKVPCDEKPEGVYLFFDSEEIDFEYEKLGLILVDDAYGDDQEQMLTTLRAKAFEHCANALIHVKADFKNKKMRSFDPVALTVDDYESTQLYYEAYAVRVTVDEAFKKKYASKLDTSSYDRYKSKNRKDTVKAILLTPVLLLVVLFSFVSQSQ